MEEGMWKGVVRDVLGEGAVGKAGVGWGGDASRSALSRVRALLPAGRLGEEGVGAPDTCWGCEVRLPDAQSGAGRWEWLVWRQPSAL